MTFPGVRTSNTAADHPVGRGYVLAAGRLELFLPDSVSVVAAYGLSDPAHPLFQRGYRSIGCAPCTVAIGLSDDDRAGRWAGRGKVECGLHTSMFKHKDVEEVKQDFKTDVSRLEK